MTVVAFSAFVVYAMVVVLFTHTGQYGNYLSPFYSPPLGRWLGMPIAPAVLVAWIPLLFRGTCYYYRREYYHAFAADPFVCARPERPRLGKQYTGEKKAPWVWNQWHRYWWFLAAIVLVFLWKDTVMAFIFHGHFGIGIGSLILLVNVVLLTAYTLSCHAFRHLVGGRLDCFSCPQAMRPARPPLRYQVWRRVSEWNRHHGSYAWASMASVLAADVYIRLLLAGVIPDVRLIK
jgi:hypothetical protein